MSSLLKYRLLRGGTDISASSGQQVASQSSSGSRSASAPNKAAAATATTATPAAAAARPAASASASASLSVGNQRKTLSIGPNTTIKAKDVISVAQWNTAVALDSVWLTRVEAKAAAETNDVAPAKAAKKARAPVVIVAESKLNAPLAANTKLLSRVEARAVILVRLASSLSLPNTSVPLFLMELLNADITPSLPATNDVAVLAALTNYLFPAFDGACTVGTWSGNYQEALKKAGLTAPGINGDDQRVLETGAIASSAIAALNMYAAGSLVNFADCVAALSCEAMQAATAPFDADNHDMSRPHKGEMTVASNLRMLLDGSAEANSSKRTTPDVISVRCIPAFHGPARDLYAIAKRAVKIDLNATADGLMHPQPVTQAIVALQGALATLASGAEQRASELAVNAEKYGVRTDFLYTDAPAGESKTDIGITATLAALRTRVTDLQTSIGVLFGATSSVDSGNALHAALTFQSTVASVLSAIAIEASVSLQALAIKEKKVLENNARAIAAKEAAQKKREAEQAVIAAKKDAPAAAPKKDAPKKDVAAAKKDDGKAGAPAANGKEGKGETKAAPLNPNQLHKLAKLDAAKKEAGRALKGLALGNGTLAVRDMFTSVVYAATPAQFVSLISDITTVLEPMDINQRGLKATLRRLLTASNQVSIPKMAKGTRDILPEQMVIREKAFKLVQGVFIRHGACGIDTPVFERKETLMGKYGEDTKLIYDLADQGGEILSLRYDLTVPFARYLATHNVENIKRYHIARVYRRDQPIMTRGRFREFYQCDFDIAGHYSAMVPDAEVVAVCCEILEGLDMGNFKVKLNHRKLLDALMASCGVPADKFRAICSAVDKLDKEPWEKVREEMVFIKGLDAASADKLGRYVTMVPDQPFEFLAKLRADENFSGELAQEAFNELELLFKYLTAMGRINRVSFDLSLARGLDYYTGCIYEAMFTETDRVGSIAAGGRYDNLVGMFSGKSVPAVGVSIGIERIMAILEENEAKKGPIRKNSTQILVATCPSEKQSFDSLELRMSTCRTLWAAGLACEFLYDTNPKLKKQMEYAAQSSIPVVVIFGEGELKRGVVAIKEMSAHAQVEVPLAELTAHLLEICRRYTL